MRTRYLRYRASLKSRARSLRRDPTPAERKLWFDFLRDLPQKFTRQKPLGQYVVDFYCSSCRMIVEVDGDSHFADHDARAYDRRRTEELGYWKEPPHCDLAPARAARGSRPRDGRVVIQYATRTEPIPIS